MKIFGTFLCLVLFSMQAVADEPIKLETFASKKILENDYKDKKYWPVTDRTRSGKAIEFCGGDWCQEIEIANANSVGPAWDALFLIFYYYDANELFTEKRGSHTKRIIETHGKRCASTDVDKKISCVLQNLQTKHKFKYYRVQYDIGARCSSTFTAAPPHFTRQGSCVDQK
jgi:hypothetical protein